MEKLRVIVADDERPAREFLKSFLKAMDDVEIVGEAEDGGAAIELVRERRPDLALLDIQMPEVSGIDVVKALGSGEMPLVAFVTAYDDFAVQAFELNAIDYLLKPIEKTRLRETLDRAYERLEHANWRETEHGNIRNAVRTYEESSRPGHLERIPVKLREDIVLVPVAEIASIVADGELLRITTESNQRFVVNYRLKDLESRLAPESFVRVSRGALVSVAMISSVSPLPGGTYQINLSNGQEICSSRLQSRILRERLFRL